MKDKYMSLKTIEKEDPKKIKVFNYGFAILKSILSFLVISAHNFKKESTNNKIILFITKERRFHVPSFFIMSFYFMHNNLLSLKPNIIFNRLMRLLIPYIGWPIIVWIINHYWNKKYNSDFAVSYEQLKLQLLWGYNFIPIYWFLWSLFMITILFIIIIFIFRKHSLFILQILVILCYSAQYSNYYYYTVFMKHPDYNRVTLSSILEDIPFAVTGFTFAHYKIFDKLQKNKIKTLILSWIIYNFFDDYNIFTDIRAVLYPGFKYHIRAICIVCIFSLFPSDKIKNKYIQKFLHIITNHTGPIYYLHVPFRDYIKYYLDDIKNGTFKGLFITYFWIYIFSFVGTLIFGKTPLKYLFC